MHGVFLDLDTVDRGDLDLGAIRSVLGRFTAYPETIPSGTPERIRDADIVISNKVRLDREALRSAGRLGLVCIAATGTNNVDLAAAGELDITVCNVTAYATPSVVEHVFSQLLILVRHLHEYRDAVDGGRWQQAGNFCLLDYPIRELDGMTLGIVGYGELGRAVAAVGRAFGMQVLVAERAGRTPRRGRTALAEVLAAGDVVSLHCPLAPETRRLIGARELEMMKPDALLVNTARGGIVDERALLHALRTGGIGGAALDVLEEEPPRPGHPLLEAGLPNLLVTPHIAWAGIRSRQRLVDQLAANIAAWQAGAPRNVVTGPAAGGA